MYNTSYVCHHLRHSEVFYNRLLCIPDEQLFMNEPHQKTHVRLWFQLQKSAVHRRSTGFPLRWSGFPRSCRRQNITVLGHIQTAIRHHDARLRHNIEIQKLKHNIRQCPLLTLHTLPLSS